MKAWTGGSSEYNREISEYQRNSCLSECLKTYPSASLNQSKIKWKNKNKRGVYWSICTRSFSRSFNAGYLVVLCAVIGSFDPICDCGDWQQQLLWFEFFFTVIHLTEDLWFLIFLTLTGNKTPATTADDTYAFAVVAGVLGFIVLLLLAALLSICKSRETPKANGANIALIRKDQPE